MTKPLMLKPLVSIIIPCYNYGMFLSQTFASVLEQSYSEWECLIIDDGSTDDSRNICLELMKSEPRLVYHYKTNGGLSSARNYGIKMAKGDYICFLDADDLLDKHKLEEQLNCFFKNPEADIIYGNSLFFRNNDLTNLYANKSMELKTELSTFSGRGNELIRLLNKGNITVVSSPLIKKAIFKKIGYFDETYKSYEDWQFWLRCSLADCYFVYCNKPVVSTYIRFGHESMMSNKLKLVVAGIQLRKFIAFKLPIKFRPYNYYRLLRLYIKLLLS